MKSSSKPNRPEWGYRKTQPLSFILPQERKYMSQIPFASELFNSFPYITTLTDDMKAKGVHKRGRDFASWINAAAPFLTQESCTLIPSGHMWRSN